MGKVDWKFHFKYYDLFQNNYPRYLSTMAFHIKELKNFKKILDSGSGSGNLTLELLKRGHYVTAVDFNEFALKILKKKCSKYSPSLKIMKSNVLNIDFNENYFDGASSVFVVPFVKDINDYFSKIHFSLKKEGKFVLSVWAPRKGLTELAVKEFGAIGFLDKHKEELKEILESSKRTLKEVLKGPKEKEILTALKKVGFRKIKVHKNNPYGKYAYFISCIK